MQSGQSEDGGTETGLNIAISSRIDLEGPPSLRTGVRKQSLNHLVFLRCPGSMFTSTNTAL